MNQDEKIRRLIRRMSAIAARTGLPLPTNPAAVERLAREWWAWMGQWYLLPRTAHGRRVSLQVRRQAEYETLFVALYV
jgi:hypothetical protein